MVRVGMDFDKVLAKDQDLFLSSMRELHANSPNQNDDDMIRERVDTSCGVDQVSLLSVGVGMREGEASKVLSDMVEQFDNS